MQPDNSLVDKQYLVSFTGDPFADVGGRVIKYLWSLPEFKEKTIIELIEYVTYIYVNNWEGKLHPFFLNSKMTQPSYIGEARYTESILYYTRIIEDKEPHNEGVCPITGIRTKLFLAGRHNTMLTGSLKYVNYHYMLKPGLYLSKEMLLRMYFVPFGTMRLAAKLSLIVSNNLPLADFFVENVVRQNLDLIKKGESKSVFKSKYNNPANALFRFIYSYWHSLQDKETDDSFIQLVLFNNMGQSPEMLTHDVSNEVFEFYIKVADLEEWKNFEKVFYKYDKDYRLDEETGRIMKGDEEITFDEYSRFWNSVLSNLLFGKSILYYILKYSEKRFFPFDLLKIYLVQLRDMVDEQVDMIKRIADFITQGDEDSIKKYLQRLNQASTRREFRKVLMDISKDSTGSAEPVLLFTLNELTHTLLPSGTKKYWREPRDIIVIAIHEYNYKQKQQSNA